MKYFLITLYKKLGNKNLQEFYIIFLLIKAHKERDFCIIILKWITNILFIIEKNFSFE